MQLDKIIDINQSTDTNEDIALEKSRVSIGFSSLAQDWTEGALDLNKHLVSNPISTFFMRIQGSALEKHNMFDKDLLIINRSLAPKNGDYIIAIVQGELQIKQINNTYNNDKHLPSNHDDDGDTFELWGVITHVIHKCRV